MPLLSRQFISPLVKDDSDPPCGAADWPHPDAFRALVVKVGEVLKVAVLGLPAIALPMYMFCPPLPPFGALFLVLTPAVSSRCRNRSTSSSR